MAFEAGKTRETLRRVAARVSAQNVSFLAGSLAYNAFVSLLPLLVLLFLVAGALDEERLAARVASATGSFLTPAAQDLVADALANTSGRTGLSVLGVLVLLWGTLKVFRGLNTAFAVIYETTEESTLLDDLRDGVTALVTLGFAVFGVVAAGAAFALLPIPFLHLLNPLLLLVGLSVAFLPLYYVFPDVSVSLREALPGAVVAAGGWAVLEAVFQVYAANAGRYEAYGILGSVLLLVTWLYFSSFVLLVGAEVNVVLRNQRRAAEADGRAEVEPVGVEPRADRGGGPASGETPTRGAAEAPGRGATERPARAGGDAAGGAGGARGSTARVHRDGGGRTRWASRLALAGGALLIAVGIALRRIQR
jgi:membrane protein